MSLASDPKKKRILFLCTGNSCRSQMAEGFGRHLGGDRWEVRSAGLDPQGVNPRAITAMAEVGIDISGHTSDLLDPASLKSFDLIVTLCGDADERCPAVPPGVKKIHWPLPDPAKATGSEDQIMAGFREVRDEIRRRVERLLEEDR